MAGSSFTVKYRKKYFYTVLLNYIFMTIKQIVTTDIKEKNIIVNWGKKKKKIFVF